MILISVILLVSFSLVAAYSFRNSNLKKYFFPGLIFKIMLGVAMGWIYSSYYIGGDTLNYFNDATNLRELAIEEPSVYIAYLFGSSIQSPLIESLNYGVDVPRAMFFSKVCSVFNLISFDNYYLLSAFISLFSFIGFFSLSNRIFLYTRKYKLEIIIAFIYFPSVVFWTSGVIKEAVAVSSLTFMGSILIELSRREKRWKYNFIMVLFFFFFLWLAWNLKYYFTGVFIAMFIPATIIYILKDYNFKNSALMIIWIILVLSGITILTLMRYNFQLENLPDVIFTNYNAFVEKSAPGDYIEYKNLMAEWSSILYYAPKALLSGLLRPAIYEIDSIYKFLTAMENLIILILLIFSIRNIPGILKSKYKYWIVSSILYICTLCTFLSLSTPNFGTLVRYKSGFLFILLFLLLIDNPIIKKLKAWKNL